MAEPTIEELENQIRGARADRRDELDKERQAIAEADEQIRRETLLAELSALHGEAPAEELDEDETPVPPPPPVLPPTPSIPDFGGND